MSAMGSVDPMGGYNSGASGYHSASGSKEAAPNPNAPYPPGASASASHGHSASYSGHSASASASHAWGAVPGQHGEYGVAGGVAAGTDSKEPPQQTWDQTITWHKFDEAHQGKVRRCLKRGIEKIDQLRDNWAAFCQQYPETRDPSNQ